MRFNLVIAFEYDRCCFLSRQPFADRKRSRSAANTRSVKERAQVVAVADGDLECCGRVGQCLDRSR